MCTFVSKCSNSKIHNSESQSASRMESTAVAAEGGGGEGRAGKVAAAARGKHCVYVECVPASDFVRRLFMHLTIETFMQHVWHICMCTHT